MTELTDDVAKCEQEPQKPKEDRVDRQVPGLKPLICVKTKIINE